MEELRPISVHGCPWRLLFATIKSALVAMVPGAVQKGQVGFIRDTVGHKIQTDLEMHQIYRAKSKAGHAMIDLERAFPSLLQAFQ